MLKKPYGTCVCLGKADCVTLRDRFFVYPVGLVKIHHHLPSNFDSLWHWVIFAANQNWLVFGCNVDALMGHRNASVVAASHHRLELAVKDCPPISNHWSAVHKLGSSNDSGA